MTGLREPVTHRPACCPTPWCQTTANLLLPERVLRLPREPAVELGRAWAALLAAAGWATAGSVSQRTPGSC
jgi:hypothetical protein